MYNILICDDEPDILNALKVYLSSDGYNVFETENGAQAVEVMRENDIHLVLMDVMMPIVDGICATSSIREISNAPIILLTAKSEDADKVLGLNIGADDYVTKPFNPAELLARVRSQLRRYTNLGGMEKYDAPSFIKIGGVELDDTQKKVTVDGNEIPTTPIEYSILKLLMSNPDRVFSSNEIYAKVWNGVNYGSDATVSVHIRHLREKLEITPAEPRYLKVVWGKGYKFEKAENGRKI